MSLEGKFKVSFKSITNHSHHLSPHRVHPEYKTGGDGSYGSRLHKADDGSWVAYARWPDRETREKCGTPDPEGEAMMREAIAEYFPETRLAIVDDLLAEPDAD